jgi:FKBP-type peptidyl-prolyl cis-trans isomerase SlpA
MRHDSIQIGSTVVMHFTIKLSDNSIAETTKKSTPARFTLTAASLQDPVETALVGRKSGEKVRVQLTPEQGYGPVLPENIHGVERHKFPGDTLPQPGDIFNFDKPNGESLTGVVLAVNDETVQVDFNHPLAGKDLLCEMEVIEVHAPEVSTCT